MDSLSGKVAFITGGASGMGLAMARTFAAAGMHLILADIEETALAEAAAEFSNSNCDVMPVVLDVGNRAAWASARDAAIERFKHVHVLCNNAGVAVAGNLGTMDFPDWDWVMRVNLDGVINGVQTFLPHMLQHGEQSHIVNTASMAGHMAVPGLGIYNTSKYAVVGLSEALQRDLGKTSVGVSVLCPGLVRTRIFESGRNRPVDLLAERDTDAMLLVGHMPVEEQQAALNAMMETALDPAVVGEMVMHAMLEEEFWIFTHPDLLGPVENRHDDMQGAAARWQTYRERLGL